MNHQALFSGPSDHRAGSSFQQAAKLQQAGANRKKPTSAAQRALHSNQACPGGPQLGAGVVSLCGALRSVQLLHRCTDRQGAVGHRVDPAGCRYHKLSGERCNCWCHVPGSTREGGRFVLCQVASLSHIVSVTLSARAMRVVLSYAGLGHVCIAPDALCGCLQQRALQSSVSLRSSMVQTVSAGPVVYFRLFELYGCYR